MACQGKGWIRVREGRTVEKVNQSKAGQEESRARGTHKEEMQNKSDAGTKMQEEQEVTRT